MKQSLFHFFLLLTIPFFLKSMEETTPWTNNSSARLPFNYQPQKKSIECPLINDDNQENSYPTLVTKEKFRELNGQMENFEKLIHHYPNFFVDTISMYKQAILQSSPPWRHDTEQDQMSLVVWKLKNTKKEIEARIKIFAHESNYDASRLHYEICQRQENLRKLIAAQFAFALLELDDLNEYEIRIRQQLPTKDQ